MAAIAIPAEVAAYVAGMMTAAGDELTPDDAAKWIRLMGLGEWPGRVLFQAADAWMRSSVSAHARRAINLVDLMDKPGRPRG